MAKIVLSKVGPDAEHIYSLGNAKPFKLAAGGSYETDDPALIGDAGAHPWLDVELDPADAVEPTFRKGSVAYEDDALAGVNSKANDADAVRKELANRDEVEGARVAIESGKDQDKVVETGGVAETVAAADAQADDLAAADKADSKTSDTPKGNSK